MDAVIVYVGPRETKKLQQKFERELKPGTLVICNHYPIENWQEIDKREFKVLGDDSQVFLYRI